MYIPAHFVPDEESVHDLLEHQGAADLVTATRSGLYATMLPFLYDPPGLRPGTGPAGSLVGHVARNNPQWREAALGDALVIVRGPDAYISPNWYATRREHGRVVPTWNYLTAHLYGELLIHDDPAWVEALVRRLTAHHEAGSADPWSVDDAPAAYIDGQLRAIVGVEVRVRRIEAKAKLSQNRSRPDMAGAIAGLEREGRSEMSALMRRLVR